MQDKWLEMWTRAKFLCDKCHAALATMMSPEGEATFFSCTSCYEKHFKPLIGKEVV